MVSPIKNILTTKPSFLKKEAKVLFLYYIMFYFTNYKKSGKIQYRRSGDKMLKTIDILDEKDKRLRQISQEVTFPMEKEDLENIDLMEEYLYNSQIEELAEKYDLRPGMGMAAVQIGVLKRYIVIVHEVDEGFDSYVVVNPKIISHSEEKIYVETGEGCLSVNRDCDGIVPRYARVTIEGYDTEGNKIKIRAREELAIAFQHEIDHLNGILFVDKIDSNNPFKDQAKYRPI